MLDLQVEYDKEWHKSFVLFFTNMLKYRTFYEIFHHSILGISGHDGMPGLPGDIGRPGFPGPVGARGLIGPQGDVGWHGVDGNDGAKGFKGNTCCCIKRN